MENSCWVYDKTCACVHARCEYNYNRSRGRRRRGRIVACEMVKDSDFQWIFSRSGILLARIWTSSWYRRQWWEKIRLRSCLANQSNREDVRHRPLHSTASALSMHYQARLTNGPCTGKTQLKRPQLLSLRAHPNVYDCTWAHACGVSDNWGTPVHTQIKNQWCVFYSNNNNNNYMTVIYVSYHINYRYIFLSGFEPV